MIVRSIKLISFRNFESISCQFGDRANIFLGKNGAGKSNLLEGIFLLLLGRSPREAHDIVMLKEGAEFYRIEGEIGVDNRSHNISIAYQKGGKRRISIDKTASRSSELFGTCAVVSASPGDIEILSGPPVMRRTFINLHLSQASAIYLGALADYHKALAQKNAYLKQSNGGLDNPYDDLMAKYGAVVMLERKKFLEAISPRAGELYHGISEGEEFLIHYMPSVQIKEDSWDLKFMEEAILTKIRLSMDRERFLQTAMVGPHRDDIDLLIGGYPARTHGSQGELRTAAIALKLAVFEYLKKIRKAAPILLFDEIFAELDENRKQKLIDSFKEFGQIFLTTATDIPELAAANSCKYRIVNGSIAIVEG